MDNPDACGVHARGGATVKILRLQAENVKRLVAVEIVPGEGVVKITGKNGQGKTSILDAIWWALAGAKHIQTSPIRNEATEARIRLDLGEVIVTRTFKRGGSAKNPDAPYTTELKVEGDLRGMTPQALLDSFVGALTFDPFEFSRLKPREQFDAFRRFVPGVDFDKYEADRQVDYSNRTDMNKRAKEQRTLAAQIALPATAAIARIDEKALIDQMESAAAKNADTLKRKDNRAAMAARVEECRGRIEDFTEKIALLNEQIAELRTEADEKSAKLAGAPKLPDLIDVAAVRAKLDAARTANEQVTLHERRESFTAAAAKYEAEAQALTERMDLREAEKRDRIAAAKLPVADVAFGDGVLIYKGVPFDQASDAERLRVSVEVAMSANPELRLIRIREGSLLDDDSQALLEKMAADRDYQIWQEIVDGSGKVGFVIEDGHARNADADAPAQAQTTGRAQPKPQRAAPAPETKEQQNDLI